MSDDMPKTPKEWTAMLHAGIHAIAEGHSPGTLVPDDPVLPSVDIQDLARKTKARMEELERERGVVALCLDDIIDAIDSHEVEDARAIAAILRAKMTVEAKK